MSTIDLVPVLEASIVLARRKRYMDISKRRLEAESGALLMARRVSKAGLSALSFALADLTAALAKLDAVEAEMDHFIKANP